MFVQISVPVVAKDGAKVEAQMFGLTLKTSSQSATWTLDIGWFNSEDLGGGGGERRQVPRVALKLPIYRGGESGYWTLIDFIPLSGILESGQSLYKVNKYMVADHVIRIVSLIHVLHPCVSAKRSLAYRSESQLLVSLEPVYVINNFMHAMQFAMYFTRIFLLVH